MKKVNRVQEVRNFFKLVTIIIMVLSCSVAGCKKDKDEPGDKPTVTEMQDVVLQGIVTDINNNPLGGVQVISGATTVATTDSDGRFIITKVGVVNKRAVLKFEKSGYFTLTRSGVKEKEMFIAAILHLKGDSDISTHKTFSTEKATTLNVGNMKVDIPSSSIMKADGKEYSGEVKADMLYLSPDNEKFASMMPGGDLAGIRENGDASMLISYGMSDVVFTDAAGNPLQIKSGTSAKVSFPVPESMKDNPPASMPLWSFDEEKGTWIEEGVFTLEGGVYVGMATHFSWINCDDPDPPTDVWGLVVDCNHEPLPNVEVFSGQTSIRTNSKGEYSGKIPANKATTLTVTVLGVTVTKTLPGYPEGANTKIPDFEMPCGVKIKGKVTDCDNRPIVNTKVSTEITATYTNSNGEYLILVPAETPVTVKVTVGGETKSENVPGKPAGETVTLPDFKMCKGGSEPGTYSQVEAASVKYFWGTDEETAVIYTWDNNGMRFRLDMLDQPDDNVSAMTILINHFDKTCFYGIYSEPPTWSPYEYTYNDNPAGNSLSLDEDAMASYRVYPDVNVAGKICKVFEITSSGYKVTYATWNGLILLMEIDGEILLSAIDATLDVPESAFTQTFAITWFK